jgi:D-3-phosphoglycerate dehydrogenase
MHSSLPGLLAEAGISFVYAPALAKDEILATIALYEGLIVRSKIHLDAAFFAQATSLKWVARAGAGMDNIDEAAAKAHNITLLNAPEGNRDAVAEHTLGLILGMLNHIPQAHAQIGNHIWQREANRGRELKNKTVGLIGYGNMGQAVAQRLHCFGCEVLAYDKYLTQWPNTDAEQVSLNTLQAKSDIVSLHIPLTKETLGWVNADFFAACQKKIWLVNTARGKIVSLADLHLAITQNKVLGAALDVLDNEKMDSLSHSESSVLDDLYASGKVIFTPHIAGWTDESYERINHVLVQKIVSYLHNSSH